MAAGDAERAHCAVVAARVALQNAAIAGHPDARAAILEGELADLAAVEATGLGITP